MTSLKKLFKKTLFIYLLLISGAFSFHDTEIPDENISMLGGVWTQIYIYENECTDNQYYKQVFDRLKVSPRFKKYSDELEHLTENQEQAWQTGGAGASIGISSGLSDCDTMATVIWEWFGNN